jgi:sarcosine oxidase subunit beta
MAARYLARWCPGSVTSDGRSAAAAPARHARNRLAWPPAFRHHAAVTETADVIVVGAGVHGASLAFHLARRGARVLVLERSTVAAAATGRSSGFVRMHYDLESESRLAWASFPYFRDWAGLVGEGDPGFVRTGFLEIGTAAMADHLRANVAIQQRIGIPTGVVGAAEVADLVPGIVTDDIVAAAWEPESGYADPSATAAGLLAAARRDGARLIQGCRVDRVDQVGDRVTGVRTDQGAFGAPVVVDAAGAWAADLAATVGLDVPVRAWRHDTAYFGLPEGRTTDFPIVIDDIGGVYFRPEGRELMLVGLEAGNEVGGSPDRPLGAVTPAMTEEMVELLCRRVPWMTAGTFRTAHGGQDGITPDQRAILCQAGPDGFYLACGFSGTGFKTAPAIGLCMTELILDGRASTVDISGYALARFAQGRPLVGEHPYAALWR